MMVGEGRALMEPNGSSARDFTHHWGMKSETNRIAERYYGDLAKTPPVSPDEERRLVLRWKQHGDLAARNALIRSHLRFVVAVARRYSRDPDRLPDLIAAGNLGLIKALDRFDLSRQTRFLTYAGVWIQSEILKEEYDASTLVYVPTHRKKAQHKKARAFRRAVAEYGPGALQVQQLDPGLPEATTVAVDALRDAEEPDETRTADGVETDHSRARLRRAVATLSAREQSVLNLFYGMKEAPRNMVQIATLLDLTPERVRQLKLTGMQQLKQILGPSPAHAAEELPN
jgi:RNA polymerase sigma factor (sigma-70 family)